MGRAKIGRLNETRINNNGEEMRIIRYGNRNDIDVQFDDGTIVENRRYDAFKKGDIKNPMTPSVYGIGCIGIGKFKTTDENGKHTKCYNAWLNMLIRCYDPKFHEKHPTYKGCSVCKEWWNFQVFAEWYYEHYYEFGNERMNLDKDILKKGNKIYSADTCTFVPQFINKLFVKCDNSRGEFPIGVCKVGNKFKVRLSKGKDKIEHLGYFNTPELAFRAYKQAKEEYMQQIAEEYKLQLPHELYEALINYKVEIND